jgi:GT2 family glycosyltransferase
MSVSVVVVAYGAGPALERCLDSLQGQCDEIVVVDNKGDAIVPPGVAVISPGENLGFARGANLGVEEAAGDVVMFLNPDAVLAPGSARRLSEVLSDPAIGIAMARLRLFDEPDKLNSAGTEVHVSGIGWAGGFGEPASSITEMRDVAAPSGAAMALRSETFRELGGFAEELFMYLEDLELGWRARIAGLRVVVVPEADVFHEYEYGRNPRKSYFLERNRLVFVLSAYSARQLVLLGPLLLVTELGMAAVALRERWLGDKLAGWGWLVRNAGTVGSRRRRTQKLRRVRDRDLARFLTATFSPGMTPVPALLRWANPLVALYWRVVRRAL